MRSTLVEGSVTSTPKTPTCAQLLRNTTMDP
jgi:hypothetical protein